MPYILYTIKSFFPRRLLRTTGEVRRRLRTYRSSKAEIGGSLMEDLSLLTQYLCNGTSKNLPNSRVFLPTAFGMHCGGRRSTGT